MSDRSIVPLALFDRNVDKPKEQKLGSVDFTIYKFNHRIKPKKTDRIKVISCFSEFGCETIGCLYCIPRLLRSFPGQYVIAMGWYGREYFYRHLVDEFWELKEEYMWLREHTRAFHHVSYNLKEIERQASQFGHVIPSNVLGAYAVSNLCRTCGSRWGSWHESEKNCPKCKSTMIYRSLFSDVKGSIGQARKMPPPSASIMDWASGKIQGKTVGIFARARKTYGRNLPPEFYEKLIDLLKSMGYNIVWLGEKQSTLACPVEGVFDFSRDPQSRDIERTLALVKHCEFTIQFWTASSRLAGMMGVPYLIVESPEQIYATKGGFSAAQEGKRLELATLGKKKILISHYQHFANYQDDGLKFVEKAILEMQNGDWQDLIGLVDDPSTILALQKEYYSNF